MIPPAPKEAAGNVIERAIALWRQNDLAGAHGLLAQCFNETRDAGVAFHLGEVLHAMGRSREAREVLVMLVADAPHFLPAHAQLARVVREVARAASPEAQRENAERRALLAPMWEALERDPFFKPSDFWSFIAAKHLRMLDASGIDNFKRTLAHNYQNWLIISPEDKQWKRLSALWKANPTDRPVLNTVESVDDAGFIWDLEKPFYALSNPWAMATYKMAVGILWELTLAEDACGFLADFEEPLIGNPIRLRRDGALISQDAAHTARELNTLFKATGLKKTDGITMAELGAGQGRWAEMVGRCTNFRYLIFDIPPTLAVSQWYIQQLYPTEKIFKFRDFSSWAEIEQELAASRFAFFTPNQIQYFPDDSVDVFVNVCSMMEMRSDQIAYFLGKIAKMARGYFMSKQYYEWQNDTDKIVVRKDDFRMPPQFEAIYDHADEIYPDLFVQIWKRKS